MTHVAFVRAINVRGHTIVAMQDLTRAFTIAGCSGVQSVIQSGNVLFTPARATHAALARVKASVQQSVGTELVMMFRTLREIAQIVEADPFSGYARRRTLKLYVAFLAEPLPNSASFPVRSTTERLEAIGGRSREIFVVSSRKPNNFYGFPNNFIEQEFGVSATTRNWTTIKKIVALAEER